jgi:hypothetical protein
MVGIPRCGERLTEALGAPRFRVVDKLQGPGSDVLVTAYWREVRVSADCQSCCHPVDGAHRFSMDIVPQAAFGAEKCCARRFEIERKY